MQILKTATFAVFTLAAMTSPVLSAATCADATDMAAFRTAAVQQQLMVAALTCRAVESYNRFVLAYRPELQKSDADLKAYFIRGGSEAAYDTFKTKLANLASLSTIANGPAYCANAAAAFDMALKSRQALSSFVADQRLMIAMPKQGICNEARPVQARMPLEARMEVGVPAPTPRPAPVRAVKAAPVRIAPLQLAAAPRLPAPAAEEYVAIAGVPAHDFPARPYGGADRSDREARPATYTYRDDRDDAEDLPLPPRPERPRMARAGDDYYAARYTYRVPPPRDYRQRWSRQDDDAFDDGW
jgi:hypothetical protein